MTVLTFLGWWLMLSFACAALFSIILTSAKVHRERSQHDAGELDTDWLRGLSVGGQVNNSIHSGDE